MIDHKYIVGQKVVIKPVRQPLSPRDCTIEPYVGQVGEITDCYWIRPRLGGEIFYIYSVRVGPDGKEIALHEDEIEASKY